MPFIKYTKRPEKGPSMKAWDLFVKKYGIPTNMIFHALCQKPPYWAANINGKLEIVKTEEIT